MTAKKVFRIASVVIFMAVTMPASSAIVDPAASQSNNSPRTEDPRGQQLLQRLEDIKGMDKSTLTKVDKKELRKEVKDIKKEMKAIKGGVYLSVGAIIIVILLLILLL